MATYYPDRSAPVIVQLRDAFEASLGLVKAAGTITFGSQVSAEDTVTIYGTVFEFIAAAGTTLTEGSDYGVVIGDDAEATRDALLAAILANLYTDDDRVRMVSATASSTDAIALTYYDVGVAGNVDITTTADNITPAGMTGGSNGSA